MSPVENRCRPPGAPGAVAQIAVGSRWRRQVLVLTVALWSISLALPALTLADGPVLSGWRLLVEGWRATPAGQPAWYANPLLGGALLAAARGHDRTTAVLGGACLSLALSVLVAPSLGRLAGVTVPELSFGIGFFVWLAAQATPFAFSLACILSERMAKWPARPAGQD